MMGGVPRGAAKTFGVAAGFTSRLTLQECLLSQVQDQGLESASALAGVLRVRTFSSGSGVLRAGKGQLRAGARPTTPLAPPGLLQKKPPGTRNGRSQVSRVEHPLLSFYVG